MHIDYMWTFSTTIHSNLVDSFNYYKNQNLNFFCFSEQCDFWTFIWVIFSHSFKAAIFFFPAASNGLYFLPEQIHSQLRFFFFKKSLHYLYKCMQPGKHTCISAGTSMQNFSDLLIQLAFSHSSLSVKYSSVLLIKPSIAAKRKRGERKRWENCYGWQWQTDQFQTWRSPSGIGFMFERDGLSHI